METAVEMREKTEKNKKEIEENMYNAIKETITDGIRNNAAQGKYYYKISCMDMYSHPIVRHRIFDYFSSLGYKIRYSIEEFIFEW